MQLSSNEVPERWENEVQKSLRKLPLQWKQLALESASHHQLWKHVKKCQA